MSNKTVTLIVLGADRELWNGGPMQLEVTDMRKGLKRLKKQSVAAGSHTILLDLKLFFDAGQVYGISVDADEHRAAWQLIKRRSFVREEAGSEIEIDGINMRLMLVPENPTSPDLDSGHDLLAAAGSPLVSAKTGLSKAKFLKLEPAEKMAMLNIDAKLRATRINGAPLLSFVEGLRHVAMDRLFLFMRSELKQLIKNSAEFAGAPGHGEPKNVPVALPAHPDSWKHVRFGAGNLQLSFAKDAEPSPGSAASRVFSVDADMDLERGLLHVAEFLDNKVGKIRKTDQTLIYALLFSQGITPDYTLSPLK
jgi:hypothetical protein